MCQEILLLTSEPEIVVSYEASICFHVKAISGSSGRSRLYCAIISKSAWRNREATTVRPLPGSATNLISILVFIVEVIMVCFIY